MSEKAERIVIFLSGVMVTILIMFAIEAFKGIHKEEDLLSPLEKRYSALEKIYSEKWYKDTIIEKNYPKIEEDTINIAPIKDSHIFTIGLIYKEDRFKYAFLTEEKEDYYMIDVDSITIERKEKPCYVTSYSEDNTLFLPKNTKIEKVEENYLKQITKITKEKNIINKINNYKSETN